MQYSMGSNDTKWVADQRQLPVVQGSFAITWQRWRVSWKSSTVLAPHITSVSNCLHPTSLAVWGGLGYNANGLDVKMESRAPLNMQPLGENPSTMLASHAVFDWSSISSMHSRALPSDNNAEASVSYDEIVTIHRRPSRAW